ncbi:MAG: response regulator, partial [Nitriliruptoraceae bacterium]
TKPVHQSQLFDAIAAMLGSPAAASAPVTRAIIAERRALVRPTVLVADDNPANQQVAAAMLRKIGYRADVVADGAEAVAAVASVPYGAVLMDVQMPQLDGLAATAEIRQLDAGRGQVPIIAMTAGAMTGERERCLAAGMDDYIAKPVDLDRLAAVLKRWTATTTEEADPPDTTDRNEGQPFDPDTVAALRSMLADDEGSFHALAHAFTTQAATSVRAARAALEADDPDEAARCLHHIAGGAGAVGAVRLGRRCRATMQGFRATGRLTREDVAAIDDELARVVAWLHDQPSD